MEQDFEYFKFKPIVNNIEANSEDDLCFVFYDGALIVKFIDNEVEILRRKDLEVIIPKISKDYCFGEFSVGKCYIVQCDDIERLPGDYKILSLYQLGQIAEEELFFIAGRANHILDWDNNHKFCSKCGGINTYKENERAKVCSKCGFVTYPVICPAIITMIKRDDKILLAHNANFEENMYSLISGFVDAGENFESAVKREVFEEIGIRVKNIRYYGNQSWAFPNSLMIGFLADYDSGEINVDGREILDAKWFSRKELLNDVNLPRKMSIARKMINKFIDNEH